MQLNQDDERPTEKKRERWTPQQTSVLVNLYTENIKVLESVKCSDILRKNVKIVNNHGPSKNKC